ncbi:hypothetical protein ORV05_22645 [Amycolatopsis cynarae]|uniref:Uncharacterized protein n=1 Tax=Amycolatopsis cynarae TaxID=2995223 RepID=A0ABY7AXY7_9PSEU|nr:hypothetical protein [Amycolatopsis sp. HUAS 11-8]WAL63787.1 hypothetical protein ORV05_22645 [Amycolatopsis sp. HUAS 11-8]
MATPVHTPAMQAPTAASTEQAVNQYNQLAEQNRQIYDQYHQTSSTVQQGIKIDYGQLPDAQDAQVSGNTSNTDYSSSPRQSVTDSGGGPSHYRAPAASAYSPPAAAPHTTVGSVMPSYPTSSAPSYNNSTSTSGYIPPSSSNASNQSNSFSPTSGFGPTGGFGPMGGGAAAGSGYGAGGGVGAGGSLQPGNQVGAGAGESMYGARPGAAGTAAGAAGASGRPGMPGGMGGAHGKGEGGDEEHETKYLLDEDGDEIFGTDEKTAPPVIGL